MSTKNPRATLEFVRMLQSMVKVEENPHYKSKKYVIVDRKDQAVNPGEVPIVLKHPTNVIVVASPTGKAPPPAVGETRVDQLSKALKVWEWVKSLSFVKSFMYFKILIQLMFLCSSLLLTIAELFNIYN